jgi:hypothetical protein
MLWTGANQLALAIKIDTWDDLRVGTFNSWTADQEERQVAPRHLGQAQLGLDKLW